MGCRWQPPAFIFFTLAPQTDQGQTREGLRTLGCGPEGQAATQPATGEGTAPGNFPLSTPSTLCPHCPPAGALTSSPQASQGTAAPTSLFVMAPELRPLPGQGAAGAGVCHVPEVATHTRATWKPGSLLFSPIRPLCAFVVPVSQFHQTRGPGVSGALFLLVPLQCLWGPSPPWPQSTPAPTWV